ncbi:MAG: hypothetical protein L0Z62_08200 [Gemmataceae bacterium]|nr:hypothetical protein [Gemmataceae bacterium]
MAGQQVEFDSPVEQAKRGAGLALWVADKLWLPANCILCKEIGVWTVSGWEIFLSSAVIVVFAMLASGGGGYAVYPVAGPYYQALPSPDDPEVKKFLRNYERVYRQVTGNPHMHPQIRAYWAAELERRYGDYAVLKQAQARALGQADDATIPQNHPAAPVQDGFQDGFTAGKYSPMPLYCFLLAFWLAAAVNRARPGERVHPWDGGRPRFFPGLPESGVKCLVHPVLCFGTGLAVAEVYNAPLGSYLTWAGIGMFLREGMAAWMWRRQKQVIQAAALEQQYLRDALAEDERLQQQGGETQATPNVARISGLPGHGDTSSPARRARQNLDPRLKDWLDRQ